MKEPEKGPEVIKVVIRIFFFFFGGPWLYNKTCSLGFFFRTLVLNQCWVLL
jgi:hypothetical protein